ncbi:MAG: hypothetical protein AAF307_06655 [Pseudomonadota bacterium]
MFAATKSKFQEAFDRLNIRAPWSHGAERDYQAGREHIASPVQGARPLTLAQRRAAMWLGGQAPACIDDFEPKDETILLIWDDTQPDSTAPNAALTAHPSKPGRLQVRIGATVMADVSGPRALSHMRLTLLPLSQARSIGIGDL